MLEKAHRGRLQRDTIYCKETRQPLILFRKNDGTTQSVPLNSELATPKPFGNTPPQPEIQERGFQETANVRS
jgi:hypothetical protein